MINDSLHHYEGLSLATRLRARPYPGVRRAPKRSLIDLPGNHFATLFVETGVARNDWGRFPYANFEFNIEKLLSCGATRRSFLRVMWDLLPGGGYTDLIDDGYVLYIEIAIDFEQARIAELEIFHPQMNAGPRMGDESAPPDTMYLNARQKGKADYCIYDKRKQLRRTYHHLRRSRVRIESRWQLNNTPRLRETRIHELASLANPFEGLLVLDREGLDEIFRAGRHANFLRNVQVHGLQHALQGRGNADQERRIRMLRQAAVPWWNPPAIWEGRQAAFESIITLARARRLF